MSTRPRPSSVLFWLLIVATAAVTASRSKPEPTSGLLLINHDGKYGYIDRTGTFIWPLPSAEKKQPGGAGEVRGAPTPSLGRPGA
jgi:hypothetical protein